MRVSAVCPNGVFLIRLFRVGVCELSSFLREWCFSANFEHLIFNFLTVRLVDPRMITHSFLDQRAGEALFFNLYPGDI